MFTYTHENTKKGIEDLTSKLLRIRKNRGGGRIKGGSFNPKYEDLEGKNRFYAIRDMNRALKNGGSFSFTMMRSLINWGFVE